MVGALPADHGRSRGERKEFNMLALTRRVGEEIVIGDPDHPLGLIRVVQIHGDKVRLALDFPREIPINRKELAEEKKKKRPDSDEDNA